MKWQRAVRFEQYPTESVPQWESVPVEQRTASQRMAAASDGWLAPGSIITEASLAGSIASACVHDPSRRAALFLLTRLGDLADGATARATETQSPLGAKLDATSDKIAIAAFIGGGVLRGEIPRLAGSVMFADNMVVSAVNLGSKAHGVEEHSSRAGKLKMGLQVVSTGAFTAASGERKRGNAQVARALEALGYASFAASLPLSAVALRGYARTFIQARKAAKNTAESTTP